MHEYSIVAAILEQVGAEAGARGAERVRRVGIRIGDAAGVDPELLGLAWETFREQSICAGAPLEVTREAVVWACPSCDAVVPPGAVLRCPDCGRPARMTAGDAIYLQRIEMEIPDSKEARDV